LSGRGLWDELITRPEESYRLCCVVVCDLETSRIGAPHIYIYIYIYIYNDISNLRVNHITVHLNDINTSRLKIPVQSLIFFVLTVKSLTYSKKKLESSVGLYSYLTTSVAANVSESECKRDVVRAQASSHSRQQIPLDS